MEVSSTMLSGGEHNRISRRSLLLAPAAAAVRKTPQDLAADHHRPSYHYLPPSNWMNAPNGPIYWKGRYHIFYQYNPNGAYWGTMHWGHAVSPDMLRWRHMPPALAPQPGSYDKDGVYSGCCVVNDSVPTLIYTATQPEVQCLASSRADDLRNWRRSERNPVLTSPPSELTVTGFRDPWVWRDGDSWLMALGSGIKGIGGCVLLYRSKNLLDWTYLHPLFVGKMDALARGRSPMANGEMWECPCYFPLGNKYVLLVSTRWTTPWYVGTFEDLKFKPEQEGRLDTGLYYAPTTQLDAQGKRIAWGWIQEGRGNEAQRAAGWSGVLSLPRLLFLHDDGRLGIAPAPHVSALHGQRLNFDNLFIPEDRPVPVPGVAGDALRLRLEIENDDADEFGLQVLVSGDGGEATPITYHPRLKRLSVGRHRTAEETGNLPLGNGEALRLDVFVDASVIEVFANGRACVTGRAYTARAESAGVALVARGGSARLRSMTVFEMRPISADRLTT